MELNERHQIKRKYGQYEAKRINASAPIRDSIVTFVGKRFVTEEELKSHLEKLSEQRGGTVNGTQWFKNNQKYFESFTNRGQNVITLSKYGKRVLEFVNTNKLNESEEQEKLRELEEAQVNEKYFNILVNAHNTVAKEIVKVIKKQDSKISENVMGELLEMLSVDFNKSGYKGLDSYLK